MKVARPDSVLLLLLLLRVAIVPILLPSVEGILAARRRARCAGETRESRGCFSGRESITSPVISWPRVWPTGAVVRPLTMC